MSILRSHIFQLTTIYAIGIFLTIFIKLNFVNHHTLNYQSLFVDNIITAIIFASYLFIFSVIYNNVNIMDVAWGYFGIILIIDSVVDPEKREVFYKNNLIDVKVKFTKLNNFIYIICGLSIIFMYSFRHILFYYRGFHNLDSENEDFRYKEFRTTCQNRYVFWIISLLTLHIIPLIILSLCFYPIFETFLDISNSKSSFISALLGFIISNLSILLTTIADEQLYMFRIQREEFMKKSNLVGSKIIFIGLWKYIRHPNYLGEILYFFSIVCYNYGFTHDISFINLIGSLSFFFMISLYSIPTMEKKLIKNYKEEYLRYQDKVKTKLIPILF